MIDQPQIPPKDGPRPRAGATGTGAAPASAERRGRHRITRFLLGKIDRVSLSAKLIACTLVVLIVGTVVISASIRQLVSSYLLNKTDTQIISQRDLVFKNIDMLRNSDNNGMNTYFLQMRYVEKGKFTGKIDTSLYPILEGNVVSVPQLPSNDEITDDMIGQMFTTTAMVTTADKMNAPAANGSGPSAGAVIPTTSNPSHKTLQAAAAPWRVGAFKWLDSNNEYKGIVFIGLSLADQIDIINTLTRYCITVGFAIVLLGGSLAALIIQRTLDPLKRIEKTAAKIAAGDLSQRIPRSPENTEVGSLSSSLNMMLARIEKSFHEQEQTTEKMKRFVSDASHELRTPLAAIHGYAELYTMQRDMPGALERADESIAHIEKSSQRMTVLVEDLLSLARLDEGRGIDMTQTVPLTTLVTDSLDDLHALDPEREVTRGAVVLEPSPDMAHPAALRITDEPMAQVTLTGDASRLRQVVTNIVGNIHRYTPADSPANVGLGIVPASITPETLSRMPATDESMRSFLEAVEVGHSMHTGTNYAVLRFEDHGPGVPEESRSQLFERFYTADPSRAREKGGTGLGLAIAQSVVKAHHGFICASATPGGGLTFTIVLPLGPVQQPVPAQGQTGSSGADADTAGKAEGSKPAKSKSGKPKDKAKRSSWFSH